VPSNAGPLGSAWRPLSLLAAHGRRRATAGDAAGSEQGLSEKGGLTIRGRHTVSLLPLKFPDHLLSAESVGLGELGTPPSRITGNHSTVSSIVMASLALLMQEGRGEPAVHPPEPPCLDEEIAAQSPYGAPDASSARAMSRSGHSKIRKAPESDSRGAGRSLRQEARTTTTRRP
jgi:hypothetical protein